MKNITIEVYTQYMEKIEGEGVIEIIHVDNYDQIIPVLRRVASLNESIIIDGSGFR